MQPVAQTPNGPFCHQVQQQAPTVRLPCPRPPGLGSGCSQSVLGGTGLLHFPTSSHLGQSGGEVTGLPMQQNNSDCPRVGSSGNVQPNPTVPAQHTKLGVSTFQSGPSQEPLESEPTCLAPRAQQSRSKASLRQWQHELRLLKGDQPDLSMRQSGPVL